MVIVMERNAKEEEIEAVIEKLTSNGFDIHRSTGVERTILGAVGAHVVDTRDYELMPGVREVHRVTSPYKLAARAFCPEGTVIEVNGVRIGSEEVAIMAGACTIKDYAECDAIARRLRKQGVRIIRGGAFKPRTSPYSFQGHGEAGLKALRQAADENGMAIISEVLEPHQIPLAEKYIDIVQIGARNMQNYGLLRELGQLKKPVLLKRGMSATVQDLLLAAEYIMSEGSHQVMLCERGIRTFETHTRNTMDISAIPVIHKLSHLPIIADPSHAIGIRDKVPPLARAAVAAGADGLLMEVHTDPEQALCDGAQTLYMEQFEKLMKELREIARAVGRVVPEAETVTA